MNNLVLIRGTCRLPITGATGCPYARLAEADVSGGLIGSGGRQGQHSMSHGCWTCRKTPASAPRTTPYQSDLGEACQRQSPRQEERRHMSSSLIYGHYVANLTPYRDEFYPDRSLEWVAGHHDGLTQDRSKLSQGDADYDAGWYHGYVQGCDLTAEWSGTCVPEDNREYWDHVSDGADA